NSRSAQARTLCKDARSSSISSTPPPSRDAALCIDAVAACALARSLTAATTLAPWAASVRAVSKPMPDDAPVTRNRFPLRSTPERTSLAVDFALNLLLICFPLLARALDAKSTGYIDGLTRDVAAVRAGEKADGFRHLFKGRKSADGMQVQKAFNIRKLAGNLFVHIC